MISRGTFFYIPPKILQLRHKCTEDKWRLPARVWKRKTHSEKCVNKINGKYKVLRISK